MLEQVGPDIHSLPGYGRGRGRTTTLSFGDSLAVRLAVVAARFELLRSLDRLDATTIVLQRARLAHSTAGVWEAADVQWWLAAAAGDG